MFHLSTVKEETYHLLKNLFTLDRVNEKFALVAGTVLALQLGHRHSIDLDIFLPQSFDIK